MKTRHILSLIVFVAALAAGAGAQTVAFGLDSCTARALRNQTAAVNARLDVEAARQTRLAALTKFFPQVSASAGWFQAQDYLIDVTSEDIDASHFNFELTRNGQSLQQQINDIQAEFDQWGIDVDVNALVDEIFNQLNIDAHLQLFDHGWHASGVAMQPLFAGGRIVNGNRLARVGEEAARLKMQGTLDEVAYHTAELYWQVVSLEAKRASVASYIDMVSSLEHDATVGVEAGVISRNDLLKVRLKQRELSSADLQLRNGIALVTMALCQYIGMPYYDTVTYLFDTLPAVAPQPGILMRDPAAAVGDRSETRLLELAEEAARLQKLMTLGEAMPQLAVGATYGFTNLTGHTRNSGIVFATASIPLTAWWETSHNARKQEILLQQAANNRADLQQQMELQVRQCWNELTEAALQQEIMRQAMADAEDNLTEATHYYQAGMSSLGEYMEAQSLLYQARSNWIDQAIAYRLKELRYRQFTAPADTSRR